MIRYHISYLIPETQFIQIEAQFPSKGLNEIDIKIPAWRPGRYQVQNFAKRIKGFKVLNEKGDLLRFKKTSKSSWQVESNNVDQITVCYEYHAAIMDAGNSWLDDEQLYLNFINCIVYTDQMINEPFEVRFDLPDDYQIACGLDQPEKHTLVSPSFYQLVDSPMFASASLRHIQFKNSGIDFHIWIQGDLDISDGQLIDDFGRYTSKQIEVMEGFPCQEYHYLFQVLPYKHYHGVEHWNSTVITLGPHERLESREGYLDLLGVSSHELFHTWNVIRLRPKEMTPYRFEGENYHTTGFITEGITTYYGDLFLARSGTISFNEYMDELNKLLKRHYENEGRKNYSLAESSYDLWLDGYEKGIPGRKVSIYNEGALAALILDLSIRLKWKNKKSLDDIIRLMWNRHGKDLSGYTNEDYQKAAEEVYEGSLDNYFEQIICGTHSYEEYLENLFNEFGLTFFNCPPTNKEELLYGFKLQDNKVLDIATDGPAEGKLMLGDIIEKESLEKVKENIPSESVLTLDIMRHGRKLVFKLKSSPLEHFSIYQVKHRESNSLQKGWLEKCIQ